MMTNDEYNKILYDSFNRIKIGVCFTCNGFFMLSFETSKMSDDEKKIVRKKAYNFIYKMMKQNNISRLPESNKIILYRKEQHIDGKEPPKMTEVMLPNHLKQLTEAWRSIICPASFNVYHLRQICSDYCKIKIDDTETFCINMVENGFAKRERHKFSTYITYKKIGSPTEEQVAKIYNIESDEPETKERTISDIIEDLIRVNKEAEHHSAKIIERLQKENSHMKGKIDSLEKALDMAINKLLER